MDPQTSFCPKVQELANGKAVRVRTPNRAGVVRLPARVDALLPAEHVARAVWQIVISLDLSAFYTTIRAYVGQPGAPAIDPALLVALWLYATLEGEQAGRRVAERCVRDLAYIWLCGGVTVNYHTLDDFRVQHAAALEALFTQVVKRLGQLDLVHFDTWAQDGMRVRASAGSGSFHREGTLERHLVQAQETEQQVTAAPVPVSSADRAAYAAQARAARERVQRLATALHQELPQVAQVKPTSKREKARTSETDPQARLMKMPDGGFRPAYNWQLATDAYRGVITGVDVTNVGSDRSQIVTMLDQVERRYGWLPEQWLVDGGFVNFAELEAAEGRTRVFAPVRERNHGQGDRYAPGRNDSPVISAWRERMRTATAQALYRLRGATAEWANAQARSRYGVQQVTVRGLHKVRCVAHWVALAHNLWIWIHQGLPASMPPMTLATV